MKDKIKALIDRQLGVLPKIKIVKDCKIIYDIFGIRKHIGD